jgi:hypothetical protein
LTGTPDRDRGATRPFLIAKDGDGKYRLIVRETRYNSQNFPIVTQTDVGETFASAVAARAFARERFGAVAGEFALK